MAAVTHRQPAHMLLPMNSEPCRRRQTSARSRRKKKVQTDLTSGFSLLDVRLGYWWCIRPL